MPGKKPSGTAGRKRKKKAEKTSKKYSIFMASFLQKAKTKEAEDTNSSESEDSSETTDRVEPYEDHHAEENMVQANVTDEENTEDSVQQNDEMAGSDGDGENTQFSVEQADDNHDNVDPAVLRFHDVGYLEFDKMTKLSVMSEPLRNEMTTLGSRPFQHRQSIISTR